MKYITKDDASRILARMMGFESDLRAVYDRWEYDFHENLGRRNALVSMSQEVETARVLSEKYSGVSSDGAAGKPDIFIGEIDAELECKLTSGSRWPSSPSSGPPRRGPSKDRQISLSTSHSCHAIPSSGKVLSNQLWSATGRSSKPGSHGQPLTESAPFRRFV